MASIIAIQPAMAFNTTASPFITTGNTIFIFPVCTTGLTVLEFNSLNASSIEQETFDLNFPLFSNGLVFGPTQAGTGALLDGVTVGSGASFNVLPFGPVNLAFPSINQKTSSICTFQRTYFFTDTFG